MRKDEIQTHGDGFGYGRSRPAFNVKVYDYLRDEETLQRAWADFFGGPYDPRAWALWESMSDEEKQGYHDFACESESETFTETDVPEVFPGAEAYHEGRSGGWIVLDGLPDVEEWDAVMVAKYARLAKWARLYVEDIPFQTAGLFLINRWESDRQSLPGLLSPMLSGQAVGL
jgi:hypothetical protein